MKNRVSSSAQIYPDFDKNHHYPDFDENARMIIGGENIYLIKHPLDLAYSNPLPEKIEDLSLLTPADHLLLNAMHIHLALALVDQMRPKWPLKLVEWITMPDILLKARKNIRATEDCIITHCYGTPEQRAAASRVMCNRDVVVLKMMSKRAQEAVYGLLGENFGQISA